MKIQLQFLRVINCGPLRDVCILFAMDGDSPVTVLASMKISELSSSSGGWLVG